MNAAGPDDRRDEDLLSAVRAEFRGALPEALGVAVSGGGDSMALLHLLSRTLGAEGVRLAAATVDHRLRPEAAAEAALAARLCEDLGVTHSVLRWTGQATGGNLQANARRARYALLGDWARGQGIGVLALGHTQDDQAETVIMRLARGAGVTGLAAMPARRSDRGITLVRPMLSLSRAALRGYLTRHGVRWAEDPSNANLRFDRVKARAALDLLAPLGVSRAALAEVADNMGRARAALDWHTFLAARDLTGIVAGAVAMDLRGLRTLPEEIARRLLLRSVGWIGGADYPPRRAAMLRFLEAVRQGRSATLGGCRALRSEGRAWIGREFNAVRAERAAPDALWDRRWRLVPPKPGAAAGCEVRALGREGLRHCPDWRETGTPRVVLLATPAVWRGDMLIAAPLAGRPGGWRAKLAGGDEAFYASLLSH